MKKILLIIFSILVIAGCSQHEKSYEEVKELIVKNMDKISLKLQKNPDSDYLKSRNFKKIVKLGDEAISIMTELYYEHELDELKSYIAAYAIENIANCNIQEVYGLTWETPDEFFEMWKNNNCSYKDKSLTNNVGNLMNIYPEFSQIVKECKINIPIFKEMIPQGITIMHDYILITAYDSKEEYNSKCYVLNKDGEIKNIVTLDTLSHVGSIEYDEVNDIILIPGSNGSLNVYDSEYFLSSKEVTTKLKFENLSSGLTNYQDSSKNQIAYLSVNDGYLYIGSFSVLNKGFVKQFQILKNDNGEISLNFIKDFKVPTKVQGITFYKKGNEKYMILSRSYGRHSSSSLLMYRYDEKVLDYTLNSVIKNSIKLPPMLEQVSMKNSLYTIFESNASKYDNCSEKIGSICLLDIDKVLNKFLEKEELEEKVKLEQKKKEKENKKKKVKNVERK